MYTNCRSCGKHLPLPLRHIDSHPFAFCDDFCLQNYIQKQLLELSEAFSDLVQLLRMKHEREMYDE